MTDVARAGADRLDRWAAFDRLSCADDMTKLLGFIGATIGGYAGWALGALAGPFAGFIVSMIGTGFGMYWGRRLAQNLGG